MPSRAHLFYNPKKVTADKGLESFRTSKCRRRSLLESVGGSLDSSDHQYGCCDVCSAGAAVFSSRLNILARKVNKRGVKRVRREVSPSLESKLIAARQDFFEKHPAYQMVGVNILCPDSSIKKLCKEARFISGIDDFPIEVRAELKKEFCSVILGSSTS